MAEERVSKKNLKRFAENIKTNANVLKRNYAYNIDETVSKGQVILKCTTAGTTDKTSLNLTGVSVGSTLTDGTAEWQVKSTTGYGSGDGGGSSSGIPYYTSNILYKVDDQVIYDDKIYKCVTAHTSTSTFDDTKWEEISSGGGISIWQANTAYKVDDVVIDSNLIWQCATAHTSTATFDESKWVCLSGGETGVQAARVTLFEGEYNTVNNSTTVLPNTLQISDSIENYDCLEFTINGFKFTNENNYMTSIVDIKDITYNNASFRITASYYDHYSSFLCTFTDSTHFAICYNDKNIWTDGKITKIVGIKYIQPDSYSTEEQLIGTWIDGRPLYRKVFENPTSGMSTGLSSSCSVKRSYGHYTDSVNSFDIPYADASLYVTCYVNNNTKDLVYSITGGSGNIQWIAVEYTK